MSDDFLDDLDPAPASKAFTTKYDAKPAAGGGGRRNRRPADPPDGYYVVPGGGSTYDARRHLSALGGYWDADAYCWYVPAHARAEATRALNEAAIAKRLNPDPDAIAAMLATNVPIKGAKPLTMDAVCWECGGSLYLDAAQRRAAHFASPPVTSLKPGAVLADAYCGCHERGDKVKAVGRPNFRKR